MKCYVTTIGEPTTDLCIWSLKRNGFDVEVIDGNDSLASKLKRIYLKADDSFYRVDADVIVNKNLLPTKHLIIRDTWWLQFQVFDWYKQDITNGGIQYIKKEALPILISHVDEMMDKERPETYMFRLKEFSEPRRCTTITDKIMGIHGYGQNDIDKVISTKQRRGQYDLYDFELCKRLNEL